MAIFVYFVFNKFSDRSFPLHVYHNSVFLYTLAIFVEQSRFYRFFNVFWEEPELLSCTYFLLNVLMIDQLGYEQFSSVPRFGNFTDLGHLLPR